MAYILKVHAYTASLRTQKAWSQDLDETTDLCQHLKLLQLCHKTKSDTVLFPRAPTHARGHTSPPSEKCKEKPLFIKG